MNLNIVRSEKVPVEMFFTHDVSLQCYSGLLTGFLDIIKSLNS